MAGRIYGLPGDAGARDGTGCRFFTANGAKIPFVTRVEFDADADRGMASVTAYMRDAGDNIVVDLEKHEACKVTFRTWVQVALKGEPDPQPLRNPLALRDANGAIVVVEDPIPDIPSEFVTHPKLALPRDHSRPN